MSFDAEVRTVRVDCPYCGERIEVVVDSSAGPQQYVEDCSVCCRPMEIRVGMDAEGTLHIDACHEDS